MPRIVLIILSLVAGVFLGVISNWLYDYFKGKGLFPDRPTLKWALIVTLAIIPLILLVALPEIDSDTTGHQPTINDAYVKIEGIYPAPDEGYLPSDVERQFIVTVEYFLPVLAHSPQLSLQYLKSYDSVANHVNWLVVHAVPAKVGTHKAQLAGEVRPPLVQTLNGETFQIGVRLSILDSELGDRSTIATDTVAYALSDE